MVGGDNPVARATTLTPPQSRSRLDGGSLSAAALIQLHGDNLIIAPNPGDRFRLAHARLMTDLARKYKCWM